MRPSRLPALAFGRIEQRTQFRSDCLACPEDARPDRPDRTAHHFRDLFVAQALDLAQRNRLAQFFGQEGLIEKGVEATWVPPLPFFVEVLGGVFNGDNDVAAINRAMDLLTQMQHKAAEALYKNTGAGAAGAQGAPGSAGSAGPEGPRGSTGSPDGGGDVIDAEVVDDK